MNLIRVTGVDTNEFGVKQSDNTFECYVNPAEIKAIVVNDGIGHILFVHSGNMAIDRKSVKKLASLNK